MKQKAWFVEEPGGKFREREIARAAPGTKQAMVRISASGVNPLDSKIRAGAAAHARQPLPAVLCVDMAMPAGCRAHSPSSSLSMSTCSLTNRKTCRCARRQPLQ
jgi:hypothetical protein